MSEGFVLRQLLVFAHGLRGVLYSGNCFVSPEIALKCSQRNRNGENHTETPPRVGRTPTQKPLRICARRFREFSQDQSSKCGGRWVCVCAHCPFFSAAFAMGPPVLASCLAISSGWITPVICVESNA